MKLVTVRAAESADDEGRVYVAVAPDEESAIGLAKAHPHDRSYSSFEVVTVVDGVFDGPARVLGYCGQGPWTWRR